MVVVGLCGYERRERAEERKGVKFFGRWMRFGWNRFVWLELFVK